MSRFPDALTERMIQFMRRDLRASIRIFYGPPEHLLELLSRARFIEPDDLATRTPIHASRRLPIVTEVENHG